MILGLWFNGVRLLEAIIAFLALMGFWGEIVSLFADRGSRQLGRPNSENGGGQDAKNLRVKVFVC